MEYLSLFPAEPGPLRCQGPVESSGSADTFSRARAETRGSEVLGRTIEGLHVLQYDGLESPSPYTAWFGDLLAWSPN